MSVGGNQFDGVDEARGCWSFLALFPVPARAFMAQRLGAMPNISELRRMWAMFGIKESEFGSIYCTVVEGENELVVAHRDEWPSGMSGLFPARDTILGDANDTFVCGLDLAEDVLEGDVEGWCHRGLTSVDCGMAWPTVSKLEELGASREELKTKLIEIVPGQYHVHSGVSVGQEVNIDWCVGAIGGGCVSAFGTLVQEPDFTICKCRVHTAPMERLDSGVVGCCLKGVGSSPVIRAAATGIHRFCHAEPKTRQSDRRMLELLSVSPSVPAYVDRVLVGPIVPMQSQNAAVVGEFGRGYCYLVPVHPNLRWRAARLFGPNPLCRDVLALWKWTIMKSFKQLQLEQVSASWYHVGIKPGAKGVSDSAGKDLVADLESVVAKDVDARIGASKKGKGIDYAGNVQNVIDIATRKSMAHSKFFTSELLGGVQGGVSYITHPDKQYCEKCKFLVNPVGHAERCFPQQGRGIPEHIAKMRLAELTEMKGDLRRLSWIGDAMHKFDLRVLLIAAGLEETEYQVQASKYENRPAQAHWYNSYGGFKYKAKSTGIDARSAAFEASYYGKFRAEYVQWIGMELQVENPIKLVREASSIFFLDMEV